MPGPRFDFRSPSKWIVFPDGIVASNSSAFVQTTFAVSIPHLCINLLIPAPFTLFPECGSERSDLPLRRQFTSHYIVVSKGRLCVCISGLGLEEPVITRPVHRPRDLSSLFSTIETLQTHQVPNAIQKIAYFRKEN
jgi:hypothetical protein